jgi:hypothetical protein
MWTTSADYVKELGVISDSRLHVHRHDDYIYNIYSHILNLLGFILTASVV